MDIESIINEWEKDSKIDITQLESGILSIPKLHSKYLRMHSEEKLQLKKLYAQFRMLRLEKYEHYVNGPSKETKNWKIPAIGRVMKQDAKDWYVDADEDVNKKQLEIDYVQEKVDVLESILNMIKFRHNSISSIMQHLRWTGGG